MPAYIREVLPAVSELVTDGRFNFGTFGQAIKKVNPLDAEKPLGISLPRWAHNLRLKEWVAFQLGNDDYFMLVVLYSAKVFCLTQFLVYDIKNKRKYLHERLIPFSKIRVTSGLLDNQFGYKEDGYSLEFVNNLSVGRIEIHADICAEKDQPQIRADLTAFHVPTKAAPIVVCIPLGENRAMYSHKCLMPMAGDMVFGSKKIQFKQKDSFAIIDDHKGFYPYTMIYDWLTAAGRNASGELVGFNLTDNQSIDSEKYNENCLWVANKMHTLPPVKFSRPDGVTKPWFVNDSYGMIDVEFFPEAESGFEFNYLFVQAHYHAPYGRVKGFIKDAHGKKVNIKSYFGMGEQKYLRL